MLSIRYTMHKRGAHLVDKQKYIYNDIDKYNIIKIRYFTYLEVFHNFVN